VDTARSRGFWAAVVAIVLLAGLLRFWALDSGLPHLMTRPDELDVVMRTLEPARGEFDLGWSVYPSSYIYLCWAWGSAGLTVGQLLGVHPAQSYLQAFRRNPERLIWIGRVLSALAGTAAVLVLMLMVRAGMASRARDPTTDEGSPSTSGRELAGAAALVAGILLATNFLHARDSHAFKPDVLLSLTVVVALAAMLPLARGGSLRSSIIAGATAGASIAAKYPGVLLLVPLYAAAVLGSSQRGWRRCLPVSAIWAGLAAATIFLASSPFLVFNPESREMLESIVRLAFPQIFAASPEAMARATRAFEVTHAGEPDWLAGLVYHASFSLRYGAGLLPALLAPVALLWGLVSRRTLPLLAALFFLVYYAVMSASPALYARYMTPLMPVLALLEAALLCALAERFLRRRRLALLAAATLLLAVEPLVSAIQHNRIASETDTRLLATEWLRENVAPGSRLLVLGTVYWGWGEPQLPPRRRAVRVEPTAEAMAAAGVQHLVTHDHRLFSSSVDPEILQRLAPRLEPLAEFDPASPGADEAVFEELDAYYIPIHGFQSVTRPGPHIRIYAFE
jgi:4-amino-4-deoxy-L-arabinose transferase-like glycosyltransferase